MKSINGIFTASNHLQVVNMCHLNQGRCIWHRKIKNKQIVPQVILNLCSGGNPRKRKIIAPNKYFIKNIKFKN